MYLNGKMVVTGNQLDLTSNDIILPLNKDKISKNDFDLLVKAQSCLLSNFEPTKTIHKKQKSM